MEELSGSLRDGEEALMTKTKGCRRRCASAEARNAPCLAVQNCGDQLVVGTHIKILKTNSKNKKAPVLGLPGLFVFPEGPQAFREKSERLT